MSLNQAILLTYWLKMEALLVLLINAQKKMPTVWGEGVNGLNRTSVVPTINAESSLKWFHYWIDVTFHVSSSHNNHLETDQLYNVGVSLSMKHFSEDMYIIITVHMKIPGTGELCSCALAMCEKTLYRSQIMNTICA